ncbi:hypothetical protein A3844_04325 [Paenibacillus helianthi]|uniref:DegT/DnrJ/EryC1/StrS family aminotransferase n=1 Tax=Paenibacillus helianthi TaxID=1349432 RepID=A0ABX3EVC2_9BACL|nr:DegT/DnrJ/EryC1/StrS family aminotransferase [Paenibacillus helianthi]OKP91074.1 hypothetical protein A3844_04325 [Paenibacillus helianthi]
MSELSKDTGRKEIPGNFFGSYLIGEDEIEQVVQVLQSQSIFRYYGPNVLGKADQFEKDLNNFHDIPFSLGVSSGTAALKCALKALGIEAGDEVIIPAYGFIATAGAVISCNAVPVFCDVDESMNMNPAELEKCITSRTKAIIPVHIMGIAANMKMIMQIGKKYSIPIVEDSAQSFGGSYLGEKLGTIGDIGCFSFQANKILSTGEGGAIVTHDEKLYARAKVYHDQGGVRVGASFPHWDHEDAILGENFRMSELTAAIGIAQLKKIPDMLYKVKTLKKLLRENLRELELNYRMSWDDEGDCGIAECIFINDTKRRNKLIEDLRLFGINAYGYYNSAVYENRLFEKLSFPNNEISYKNGLCSNAERLSRQTVWIAISPLFGEENITHISETFKKCY